METATQTLHRLTSYTPGRAWDQPADDPRVVQDLQANDMDRFPWFCKRYPHGLPHRALPRTLPPTTALALAAPGLASELRLRPRTWWPDLRWCVWRRDVKTATA